MQLRPATPSDRSPRRRTRRLRPLAAAAALAAALGPGPRAAAQDAAGDEVLSSALTREALALLAETAPGGGAEAAGAAALDAAAVLMDLSAELTPGAAEMQWLRADLAERRGDTATLRDALGAYLRERPADDAALLKAALVRVSEAQTLDGRLERMLDAIDRTAAAGEETAPLRSRLAMLASEAADELGDARRALGLLATAAKLDPANARPAEAVFRRLSEAGAAPKSLGAAAANWAYAAPVDPAPRLALARVLAAEGVHGVAAEQYDRAAVFAGGNPLPASDLCAWAAALAADGREAEARNLLESAPQPASPADAHAQDLLRLALAEPGGEARAMDRLLQRLEREVDAGGPDRRSDTRLDRAVALAAFAVRPVEEAERALEQAGGRYADADPRREVAAGWIAFRRGDLGDAQEAFAAAPALPMARWGLANATDGGDPERLRLLRGLAAGGGDPATTALAARALREEKREVEPTAVGRAVLDVMAERPSALWRMRVEQEPLVGLSVSAEPSRLEPFKPAVLNLRISNRSRLPVALGPDQTLRPVAFANVGLFRGEASIGSLPPQVFNVGRRLTLAPGASFTVPARLDHGPLGRRLAEEPGEGFRFGIAVTLDPRLTPDGAVAMGPLGAVDTLRSVQAGGEPATEDAVRGWLDAMSGDSPEDEYVALVRLSMLQGGGGEEGVGPDLLSDAAELLAERGPQLGRVPLALCGLYLRAGSRRGPAVDRVLAAARSSGEDVVRVSTLLGQVRDPGDPALDAAVRAGSPRLRRFAEAYSDLLAARDPAAGARGSAGPGLLEFPEK